MEGVQFASHLQTSQTFHYSTLANCLGRAEEDPFLVNNVRLRFSGNQNGQAIARRPVHVRPHRD